MTLSSRLLLSLCLVALLWIGAPASSAAQALVSPAVLDQAASGASVRVLVRLLTPAFTEARLAGPAAVSEQRQRIAAVQERVRQSLGRPDGFRRFRSLPWIAMDATPAQLAQLRRDPSVAAITRDLLMRPAVAESAAFIGAPTFWQVGYRGEGWTVAVLDTGVDANHPAIAGRVVHEACFSTTSASESATSLCAGGASSSIGSGTAAPCSSAISGCYHGTVIAGIIAGRTSNATGVAPNTTIAAIQVYSRIDDQSLCGTLPAPCALSFTSDQIAGLEHVLDYAGPANAAKVAAANMSLSGAPFSGTCDTAEGMPAFKVAVDNLLALEIPTVVASGNQGYVNMIGTPACVSSAVSVGATFGDADVLSGLSNRSSVLSLVAPGTDIRSSVPGGSYGTFQGTSLSAAFVSSGWALLKQFMPKATAASLLEALRTTGVAVPDSTMLTYPRIRLVDAALFANGGMPVAPGAPTSEQIQVDGNHVSFAWDEPLTGNGVTNYVVSAGSQPGASDVGVFDVGFSRSIAALAGPGTYYARVQAQNPAGTGPATPDLSFTIAPPQPPEAPTMLASIVDGRTVTLTWQAPATGSTPTSYIVEAGSAPDLGDLAVFDTGSPQLGVFVAGVPPATYYVRVRARTSAGVSVPTADIIVIVQ